MTSFILILSNSLIVNKFYDTHSELDGLFKGSIILVFDSIDWGNPFKKAGFEPDAYRV
jgi:hypothetical protein